MDINNFSLSIIVSGLKELKSRLIFLFFSIIVFRIGTFIPIPGINFNNLIYYNNYKNNFINFFNLFSGGSLKHASILTLGVIPYISSSIIIQLFTIIFPYFINLRKEGIVGKYKINQYIKYLTLLISIIQSLFIISTLVKYYDFEYILINNKLNFYIVSIFSLVAGTMFLMWLGNKISERGLGNGISIIIFIGIISNLFNSLLFILNNINFISFIKLFFVFFFIFFVMFFIVYIEMAQRKICIYYASRRYGNKYLFNLNNNFLPFKVNMSGVIPSIFSSSIILIPSIFIIWLNNFFNLNSLNYFVYIIYNKNFFYLMLYLFLIVFFSFFYTLLMYNSNDISDNLKKSGAYIPGIRPGFNTSIFLNEIILRLTLFSSLYMCIVCLIPDFIYYIMKINFYFGGTSLLIVIIVIMDLFSQIQSLMMSNKYSSILNKSI